MGYAYHAQTSAQLIFFTDTQFAQWVSRQRVFKNKGKLTHDKIKRLESIGFVSLKTMFCSLFLFGMGVFFYIYQIWSANEAGAFKLRWEQRLEELKEYKAINGTCAVPYRWAKNTQYVYHYKNAKRY